MKTITAIIGAAALIGMVAMTGCKPAGQAAAPAPAVVAAPAPAPASAPVAKPEAPKPDSPSLIVDTFGGGKFDLAQHRGKWVVVNFWATWCTPCLKEIPDLDAFDKSRADVDTVGLAYEEIERDDMIAFLKEHPISYPIAVLDVYNPPPDFDTPKGLPMTYLIAPDGKVAEKFLGPISSDELVKAMAKHDQVKPKTAA